MNNRRWNATAAAALLVCALVTVVLATCPVAVTVPLDDFAELGAAVVAVICCAWTARRSEGRRRTAWALIGASAASWAIGQAVWTWVEVFQHQVNPFPGFSDAGYLDAVPLLLLGLFALPVWPEGSAAKVRAIIDGLIITGGLMLISWHTVLSAVVSSPQDSQFAQVVSMLYPVSDVIVLTVLLVMWTRAQPGGRTVLLLLSGGLGAMALSDSTFAYLQAQNSFGSGSVLDVGWIVGYVLVGLAALYASSHRLAAGERYSVRWRSAALPYLPLPLAIAFGFAEWTQGGSLALFTVLDTLGIFALVLFRQGMAVRENVALLRSLAHNERELHHRAEHDPLTDLANRASFIRRVDLALRPFVYGRLAAVMFVDLDDFKRINDSLGHAIGDDAITTVGRRLLTCVRDRDLVARLGGDEFAVFLDDLPDVMHIVHVAERIIESLNQPLQVMHGRATVGGSIGIAIAEVGDDAGELLRRADIAMYAAKSHGKGLFAFYEPSINSAMIEPLERRAELQRAAAEGQFVLHYQPIVDTGTRDLVGCEALIRWQHPTHGLLPPAEFLGTLEESRLMPVVGAWVVQQACRDAVRLRRALGGHLYVTVNAAPSQLLDGGFVEVVTGALRDSGLPARGLVVELTESGALGEGETVSAQLRRLRAAGVRVALDDFGSGYSSFTHLRRLRVDILKIEKSFIDDLLNEATAAIVEGMLAMGARLGLTTVGEGVESEAQHQVLAEMGCSCIQGYLHARPVPIQDLLDLAAPRRTADDIAVAG